MSHDSRNNMFTPTEDKYLETSVGLFSKEMGSDNDFQWASLNAMNFWPLSRTLTFGIMGSSILS